jgi:hypothetical protein
VVPHLKRDQLPLDPIRISWDLNCS